MTTRQAIQTAVKIANENGDNLVVACLHVIEAQYIVGEIGEVAGILVALAQQKINEYEEGIFPCELTEKE